MLTWHEITTTTDPYLPKALQLYKAAFEESLRESDEVLERAIAIREEIRPNGFHFLLGVDEEERVAGLTIANYLSTANVGFIVYLAVNPDLRSQGLGSKILQRLEELFQADAQEAGKGQLQGIVLETEEDEDYERRMRFFIRQGFALMPDVVYSQPALHATTEPVPLQLFFKGTPPELSVLVRAMYEEKYHLINSISRDELDALL